MSRALETAEIIAVGSELLTPHRIDTNSLFLTGRLNDFGVVVRSKSVVGDRRDDLAIHLRAAIDRADLVIMTGGLGPTDDDLTRDVLADVMGVVMDEQADLLEDIRARFARRGAVMPAINRRQAMVPRGATPLSNALGSAPGLVAAIGDAMVVALPGPPRELQPMFESYVAPLVAARTGARRLQRRVLKMTGRSESQVEELAYPVYSAFGTGDLPIQTTILASPGQIELHLAIADPDVAAAAARLDDAVSRLAAALGGIVFSTDNRSLEAVVGDALIARAWRIAAAESCTGGLVMARFTDVPGSSAWFSGGVVAYDNAVKVRDLGIAPDLLARWGAVSEPVAEAMAENVRTRFAADVGIGVTGIAGPTGGTPEKPVGTVALAVAARNKPTVTRLARFPGDRETVRRHATFAALDMVRSMLAE